MNWKTKANNKKSKKNEKKLQLNVKPKQNVQLIIF